MKTLFAFLQKEWVELVRSGRLTILAILFVLLGIMNPAISKLTPWLMETMAGALAETGLTVTAVSVDALTSWTQFFKNIPIGLIAFVLIEGGIFTTEYQSGTLTLVLTKGLARCKVVLAKWGILTALWTVCYWLCFAVTWGYNAYFWDNRVVCNLMPAAFNWWLFGVWTVALMTLFSTLSRNHTGVLLGTGGTVLGAYLLSLFPKAAPYLPTALMNTAGLLAGAEGMGEYWKAIAVAAVMTVLCVGISVPVMNRKRL